MIDLTWGRIADMAFHQALHELKVQKLPYPITQRLFVIMKALEIEHKKFMEQADIFRDKFMVKGEDGKFSIDASKKDEFKAAEAELLSTRVRIDQSRIKHSDLAQTRLSVMDLAMLEPLIEAERHLKPVA